MDRNTRRPDRSARGARVTPRKVQPRVESPIGGRWLKAQGTCGARVCCILWISCLTLRLSKRLNTTGSEIPDRNRRVRFLPWASRRRMLGILSNKLRLALKKRLSAVG
jgi:hypothetical protein